MPVLFALRKCLSLPFFHCGLWRCSTPRPPPDVEGLVHGLDGCFSDTQTACSDQPQELTYVDTDTLLATF